ncbi:zinc-dependent metalloprotease [Nocardioides caldifontis]|uniref:zinc-dependent metalloprotease n=1 Tax=Nocardioides caldifontis TaxID=2588938 RepID=UPI0011DF1944|nr:zinc-dependent metalloprotease [Nocardioides caldifontis]
MSSSGQMVDWNLAVATATRMAGQGPDVSRAEADEVVAELREGAARSTPLVREYTGLTAEAGTAPVLVVDRGGWIQANADAFSQVMGPVVEKLQQRKGAPSGLTELVGSRVTGLEAGALLGFLAGKVLGQFDPFHTPGDGSSDIGRLLLVAPNIVQAEREIGADPTDFRLWVCLHEETHRVQFTAVPWMRDHLQSQIDLLVDGVEVDPGKLAAMLGDAVKRAGDLVTGRGEASLIDLFATPAQREVIDRVTGVMSLLEGHADVVMDGVGPTVIPSVKEIRAKFNRRRKGAGSLDRLLRRLLGLDAKMAQYRDGAHFVRTVVRDVGMDGFNKVWVEPDHLPSKEEIAEPLAWVRRVHG